MTRARSAAARPRRRTGGAHRTVRRPAAGRFRPGSAHGLAGSGRRSRSGRRRRGRAGRRRRAGRAWTTWLPVGLVAAAALLAVVGTADRPAPATLTGYCTVAGSGLTLTTEQAGSAATIAAVGHARGLPERAVVIALATAQQESRLRNLDTGDRDSLGLFQQRPSQGWGTAEQVRDPVHAAGRFYDRLVRVPGWETGRLTEVSQAVQRSGFPEAYQQHEPMAQELAGALTATGPGRLTCTYSASPAGGRLSERTAAVAAAVESELGVPATEEFGAVSVDPAAGWAAATWAVANAERLQLASVAFAGQQWTPAGGWSPSDAGKDEIGLELTR